MYVIRKVYNDMIEKIVSNVLQKIFVNLKCGNQVFLLCQKTMHQRKSLLNMYNLKRDMQYCRKT